MTQNERILKALKTGASFSPAQLAQIAGTTQHTVRARVSQLRKDGHAVYSNARKTDGKTVYRLGTPSREMVAMAYAVMGSQVFGQ